MNPTPVRRCAGTRLQHSARHACSLDGGDHGVVKRFCVAFRIRRVHHLRNHQVQGIDPTQRRRQEHLVRQVALPRVHRARHLAIEVCRIAGEHHRPLARLKKSPH